MYTSDIMFVSKLSTNVIKFSLTPDYYHVDIYNNYNISDITIDIQLDQIR